MFPWKQHNVFAVELHLDKSIRFFDTMTVLAAKGAYSYAMVTT